MSEISVFTEKHTQLARKDDFELSYLRRICVVTRRRGDRMERMKHVPSFMIFTTISPNRMTCFAKALFSLDYINAGDAGEDSRVSHITWYFTSAAADRMSRNAAGNGFSSHSLSRQRNAAGVTDSTHSLKCLKASSSEGRPHRGHSIGERK
jgi:hypothetical protein